MITKSLSANNSYRKLSRMYSYKLYLKQGGEMKIAKKVFCLFFAIAISVFLNTSLLYANSWDQKTDGVISGISTPFAFLGGRDRVDPTFVDIDGDGDQDFFIHYKEPEPNVIFVENIGNRYQPSWKVVTDQYQLQLPGGSSPYEDYGNIAFVDIDSDSDYDIFVGGGSFHFFRNIGNAQNPQWSYEWSDNLCYGLSVTFADIDNDGDSDMFAGWGTGKISFVRNDGTPYEPVWILVTEEYASIEGGSSPDIKFVDIDDDGDYDLFKGCWSGEIYFYRNDGNAYNPVWTLITTEYVVPDHCYYSCGSLAPAFCDLDSDGDYDLLLGTSEEFFSYWENTGTPQNASWSYDDTKFKTFDTARESDPVFADIDGDGDQDLFIASYSGGIEFYRNDGSVANPNWVFVTDNYNSLKSVQNITFADIDADGDLDLFCDKNYQGISFYRNEGNAQNPIWIHETNQYGSISIYSPISTFFDIDDDGDLDLFIRCWTDTDVVLFYRNDGSAQSSVWTFITDSYIPVYYGYRRERLTFFDVDQDGDFDLFAGNFFYSNVGSKTQAVFTPITANYNGLDQNSHFYGGIGFCDLDGDGKKDMITGDKYGGLYAYKNNLTHFGPIYVDVANSGDPQEDGTQEHPFDTIQEGVDFAVSQDVIVAKGLYQETVTLRNGVHLIGTSGGILTPDDPSDDVIINPGSENYGIYLSYVDGAIIDGFSITGSGGGIICESSGNVTIKNCKFTNNSRFRGSGCDLQGSSATVENSIFSENGAGYGTLCVEGSYANVKNCLFAYNGTGTGYVSYIANGATATFMNCTLDNNNVYRTLLVPHSNITFRNLLITNNISTSGDVIRIWGTSSGSITHCDLWNNTGDAITGLELITFENNTYFDPLFVVGSLGDYYLSQVASGQPNNSPCVDTGNDTAENLSMDLYTTRTDHVEDSDVVDLGFHYILPLAPPPVPPIPIIVAPSENSGGQSPYTVAFVGDGTPGPGRTITEYHWDFGDGETSDEQNPVHTFYKQGADATAYTVSLDVVDNFGLSSETPATVGITACFIATAAYGTPLAEEINVLREFRDEYLLTNSFGRKFCEMYYKNSPPAAEFIADKPALRAVVRFMLKPVIWIIKRLEK